MSIDAGFLAVFVSFGVLLGVYLGHYLTMKAFSHIQPPTFSVMSGKKVKQEPDPYEYDDGVPLNEASPILTKEQILEKVTGRTGRKPEDTYGVNE